MIPPILCYHKIDPRLELGFTRVGPRVFRRQVEALAKRGFRTVRSAELPTLPLSHSPTVVLTFDDGYSGLAEHAFPVLADHGFTAIVFVITDFVGRENTWDMQYGWRKFFHLSWDQLGYWKERGIEVHSHGASHARLTWLPDDQVTEELGKSREAITSHLGTAPAGVSYPFGTVDARVRDIAVKVGYSLGFAGPGWGKPTDPMLLERLPVYAWDAFAPPLVLGNGPSGAVARGLASATNKCAVGTAFFQRMLGRRYR